MQHDGLVETSGSRDCCTDRLGLRVVQCGAAVLPAGMSFSSSCSCSCTPHPRAGTAMLSFQVQPATSEPETWLTMETAAAIHWADILPANSPLQLLENQE